MFIFALLLTATTLWFLLDKRAPETAWLISGGILLLLFPLCVENPFLLMLIVWPPALIIMLVLGYDKIRQKLISAPLLKQFRKVMPAMSTTEQEALDAGTVWWDGELFSGRPQWSHLLDIPPCHLNDKEQAFLDNQVQQLCEMIDDWQTTRVDKDLAPEVWQYIKKQGFWSLIIPEEYGGLAFSAYAHSQIVMKVASRSVTAAVTIMVPNSLGPGKLLLHYGTLKQKNYYLPRLARGEEIPCFALTGPKAGSDAGALPDNGIICYGQWQGEKILGILLNWEKRYITLGPVASLIGLAFHLYDPDQLLGEQHHLGITVALIPRDLKGVEIGKRHIPLDIPFQNGPNKGKDVFIPLSQIIGGKKGIGQGWRMLVECLAEGRAISLPALSTSGGKAASRYTGAYARVRRQFNLPIGYFEGVEEALARIAGYTYQMDAARQLTLSALDCGEKPAVVSAIIKYHLTEKFRQVMNDAMDIQGGSGICLGKNNLLGRVYQSIPIAITVEGANILTRSMIIFGQGAIRCHPWVLKEFNAVHQSDSKKALKQFDSAFFGHIRFLASNIVHSFSLGLTRGRFSKVPEIKDTKRQFQYLNWLSSSFALCADIAMMTLGGALKRKERLSARLGDILSELYLTSAVLKHFNDQGCPEEDKALMEWTCQDSFYRMQEAFRSFLANLPFRPLAWLLRFLIFPRGLAFSMPSDKASHQIARILLSPSESRERLTSGIFNSDDLSGKVGRLEACFKLAVELDSQLKTLRQAVKAGAIPKEPHGKMLQVALEIGVINQQEHDLLVRLEELTVEVIAVDDFDNFGEQFVLAEDKDNTVHHKNVA